MAAYTQTGILAGDMLCPHCNSKGQIEQALWHCSGCASVLNFSVLCDECLEAVQRFSGCGCSEHYYCRTCREAKSRRAVIYNLSSIGA